MDFHCQAILESYDENQETFAIIKKIVLKELNGFVASFGTIVNSVEGRVKTRKSLAGKLEYKGHKYKDIFDITDLVGCRVVTFYSDEVDKYAAKIEQAFTVDWDNSVDKRKIHTIDQFGYMSVHYICQIPESMYKDEEHPLVNKFRFEIQLRSVLQHTWATIYHDTGYKNDIEVPKEYLRSLNRLAGLLEIADESFKNIKTSLNDYRRRVKQVVKNGNFKDVELNGDSFKAYLDNGGFHSLNERIASINNMDIEPANLTDFLKVFSKMGFTTLGDVDDLVKNYSEMAYQYSLRQFDGLDLDIISEAAAPLALTLVYLMNNGKGNKVIKALNIIYGERRSNMSYSNRILAVGEKMGILKNAEKEN